MDSDDEWSPSKLQDQLKVFVELGDRCVLVYSPLKQVVAGKPDRIFDGSNIENKPGKIYDYNFIGGNSVALIRKQSLEAVGLFDENLPAAQDWDLWLRLNNIGYLGCANNCFTIQHFDTQNSISGNQKAKLAAHRVIYYRHIRPYERNKGRVSSEFYIIYGDLLYAAGRRKAARRSFRKSLSIKFKKRAVFSLFALTLSSEFSGYQGIFLLKSQVEQQLISLFIRG